MNQNETLNLATVLAPLVQYMAASGNGDQLAKVIDVAIGNIGDESARAPAKGVLMHMASIARNVESQKAK